MIYITDHLTNNNQGTEALKGVFYLLYLVVISCFHKITSGTNLRLNLGIKWKGSTQLRSNLIETQTLCTNERSKFIMYYLSILRFSKTWNIKIGLASVNEHEKLNQWIKNCTKNWTLQLVYWTKECIYLEVTRSVLRSIWGILPPSQNKCTYGV